MAELAALEMWMLIAITCAIALKVVYNRLALVTNASEVTRYPAVEHRLSGTASPVVQGDPQRQNGDDDRHRAGGIETILSSEEAGRSSTVAAADRFCQMVAAAKACREPDDRPLLG